MNIHIVQLPHTFPYLIDLSLPFHQHGFDTVTLVANGFDDEQIQLLRVLVKDYDFLNILDVPSKRILSHGQALNHAFQRSEDPLFCFADHDIFPTQPLADEIQSTLNSYDVACLGDRPENVAAEYRGFAASATATQSGVPLATSFFSVFKKSVVESANRTHQVGFEQYFRKSQIPEPLLSHEDIQALHEPFLVDTCKALSLALHETGKTVKHLGSDKVCHLGGLSGAINRFINDGQQIQDHFEVNDMPDTDDLENYYRAHQRRHPKVMELKRAISDYSLQLLMALQDGRDIPQFTTEDNQLNNTIVQIVEKTSAIFQ